MNTEQLYYFELVYELHSYAAAARQVPMSPQGLTKALRALQAELGVTLFELDDAGAPMPTAYAAELHEYAEVMHSNRRLLDEAFRRISGNECSEIRLGCSLGVIGALGPDFLEGFRGLHPNVHVSYWETNDDLCDRGLADGSYDLALAVTPIAPGLESELLYSCPVYYWVNAADKLASKDALSLEDLAGYDVAVPGEGFKCYELLKHETARLGVELGHVFEMSEIFHLYEFAAAGRGVGFTARHHVSLSMFANDDRVRAVPMADSDWGFAIVRLPVHALTEAERAFWRWCETYARKLGGDPVD